MKRYSKQSASNLPSRSYDDGSSFDGGQDQPRWQRVYCQPCRTVIAQSGLRFSLIYLHADLTLKQAALDRINPPGTTPAATSHPTTSSPSWTNSDPKPPGLCHADHSQDRAHTEVSTCARH